MWGGSLVPAENSFPAPLLCVCCTAAASDGVVRLRVVRFLPSCVRVPGLNFNLQKEQRTEGSGVSAKL